MPIDKNNIIRGNSYWMDAELVVEPGTTAVSKLLRKKIRTIKPYLKLKSGTTQSKNQLYVDRSNAGKWKNKKR